MTETSAPQVVRTYLSQLDAALREVPEPLALDIRAGIAEELEGLDAAAAAERIEQLGDPAFIAAEAGASTRLSAAASAASATGSTGSQTFVVTAALLVAFGGLLVPVVGWIAGVVMVVQSPTWRLWEKVCAIVLPVALGLVGAGSVFALRTGSSANAAGEIANPLVPAAFDLAMSGAVLIAGFNVAAGIWLLVRGLRRVRA